MTVKRLMLLALRHFGTSMGRSVRIIVCSTDTATISCAVSELSGTVLTLTAAIRMGGIGGCFAAGVTDLCPLTMYSTCVKATVTTAACMYRYNCLAMRVKTGGKLECSQPWILALDTYTLRRTNAQQYEL